jgi:hypothetical protein
VQKVLDLYHFTCHHGHDGITKTGILVPGLHPLMRYLGPLLWLTDLPDPTAESVGLTSEWITCDRLAYRYSVRTRSAVPWSRVRKKVKGEVVATLESFVQPEHWWVVRRPLTRSEFSFDERWTHDIAAMDERIAKALAGNGDA